MSSPQSPTMVDAAPGPRVPSFGVASRPVVAGVHPDSRSLSKLALLGSVFAFAGACLVCFSPRWYSGSLLSTAWQSLKMVFLPAATGAAVVRSLWGLLASPPAASPTEIACSLSASWLFLPCIVMLYEADSSWMLVIAALSCFLMVLGMRLLLPAPTDAAAQQVRPSDSKVLQSLDGLPAPDSPLMLAAWIAVCAEAAVILAAGDLLAVAAIPLCIGVFLFTWRWSSTSPGAVRFVLGTHPPLRQAGPALVFTALCLIPYSVSHRGGLWSIRHTGVPPGKRAGAQQEPSSAGYAGILLYPPPVKKQLVAPMLHEDAFRAGVLTRPMKIPFDGAYWYFKAPSRAPGAHAHIARARPTDVNVHSTDRDPLIMEAHQNLDTPIDLATCGEIDLAITNADNRPGEIDVALLLEDSTMPGSRAQFITPQPVTSSQGAQIPLDRPPHETLHFQLPAKHALEHFNRITVLFLPSTANRARLGAKISVDSFELMPRP